MKNIIERVDSATYNEVRTKYFASFGNRHIVFAEMHTVGFDFLGEEYIVSTEIPCPNLTDMEKRMVAYHEVGHALVAALEKNTQPVSKITIVPHTDGALGYTLYLPEEEKFLMSREDILTEIRTLLARGLDPACTALQAIGYKEFIDVLDGNISVQDAADQVRQASRHYAKRQLTWFRRIDGIKWVELDKYDEYKKIIEKVKNIIAKSKVLCYNISVKMREVTTE